MTFYELGLNEPILKGIEEMGFVNPTPIQSEIIPLLINEKKDIIGLAQTGTGKTAAFGLPALHYTDTTQNHIQTIVISPTRELAIQINDEVKQYGKYIKNFKSTVVYGGSSIEMQMRKLKEGVHFLVATPGRLMDLIERKALKLNQVHTVILDEADEMLNMGFKEDIESILESVTGEHTTWLFSATMPREIENIANRFLDNPSKVSSGKTNTTAERIEHIYYATLEKHRYAAIRRIIDANDDLYAIIFCQTKHAAQEIAEKLMADSYDADSLHGDLSQGQREKIMRRFKDKTLRVLVATDVAARGIDVDDITHVIHHQLPQDLEVYTHRSGRTARAGKSGISMCFINTRESNKIRQLERDLKIQFKKGLIPSGKEVCDSKIEKFISNFSNISINKKWIGNYQHKVEELMNQFSKEELIQKMLSFEIEQLSHHYLNAPDLNIDGKDSGRSRRDDQEAKASENSAKLFFNIGSKDIDKRDFYRMIIEEGNIDRSYIGEIIFKETYSFVRFNNIDPNQVMSALEGITINNRKMNIELSSGSEGGGGGERRRSGGGYGGGNRNGGGYGGRGGRNGGDGRIGDDREKKSYSGGGNRNGREKSYSEFKR
jgi:ATP-dependent RNA helicase DeaD